MKRGIFNSRTRGGHGPFGDEAFWLHTFVFVVVSVFWFVSLSPVLGSCLFGFYNEIKSTVALKVDFLAKQNFR